MAATLIADASTGHAAGDGGDAVAVGSVTAGQVAVQTGVEPQGSGLLVNVTLSVDPGEIAAGHTFTVTQTISTGFGAALTFTTQSTVNGFTLTPTTAVSPNTIYLFTWTG